MKGENKYEKMFEGRKTMTYVPEYWKDNKKRIVKAKKHTT